MRLSRSGQVADKSVNAASVNAASIHAVNAALGFKGTSMPMNGLPSPQGLYDPSYEHDACGVGFICHIKGKASHQIVSDALQMLENMNHRGACGCEENSGDGAGILVRIPDAFLREKCAAIGINLPKPGSYAVGQVFLPQRHGRPARGRAGVREGRAATTAWSCSAGATCRWTRRSSAPTPRKVEPKIRQVFLGMGDTFYNRTDFDRRLYLVRQRRRERDRVQQELSPAAREDFYICTLSTNRIVYKGMLTADQLRHYYPDLQDPEFVSALAMVHSRFSTNTFPAWRLAHPYRMLAHNGEINTLRGNRNWMRARSGSLQQRSLRRRAGEDVPAPHRDRLGLGHARQRPAVPGRQRPRRCPTR